MRDATTTYRLRRFANGCFVFRHQNQPINPRLDLFNHSPAGLDWGYGGSGPAQTALAILADFLEDDAKAVRLHQTFKFALIGGLPVEGGEITGATILEFVRVVEAQAEAAAARK